jgi:beta-N-acetylhexosaminidase
MPTFNPPIGEQFILGFDNSRLDLLVDFHSAFGLGGVILFSRNGASALEVESVLREIRSRTEKSIIVAIDQEGGGVVRLAASDFAAYPSPAHYGKTGDLGGARLAAHKTARNLKKIGVNLNLNPVADVLSSERNQLMTDRCYSNSVDDVCEWVQVAVEEQSRAGIASCAKHFPGLGSVEIDPHESVSECDEPISVVESTMLPPFSAAISAGCPVIMTTHVRVPALDSSGNSATGSSAIVEDLLRQRMRFEGIVLTDDLDMGGAGDLLQTAPVALNAGHDMLLICHSCERALELADSVAKGISSGRLSKTRTEKSLERVHVLKESYEI